MILEAARAWSNDRTFSAQDRYFYVQDRIFRAQDLIFRVQDRGFHAQDRLSSYTTCPAAYPDAQAH
jgi:hypothetical protein